MSIDYGEIHPRIKARYRIGCIEYLASPYSHSSYRVRARRYREVVKTAAALIEQGRRVFCPIAHSHPIALAISESCAVDFDVWMAIDLPILRHASKLVVLKLPGWDVSRGVAKEIEVAQQLGIPIEYLEFNGCSK